LYLFFHRAACTFASRKSRNNSVLSISFLIYINNTSITLLGINRFYELLATGDSSMRLFLFSESIKLYTLSYENLIFGSGLGNFQTYIGMPGIGMYPHNLFLELLAECGSIGFVLFIIPIVYLFKLRKMRLGSMVGKHRLERMVFFVFLYFCIITSFSGGFETSFLFVFIIYLLFVDKDIPRQAKKEVVREIRTVS